MSFSENTAGNSILIVQVEPPQREDGGDYYYRTQAPSVAAAQQDGVYVINLTNVHRKKEEIMRTADVLVLKNICDPDLFPIIKWRKEQAKLTVFELADDICSVQPWNPVYFFYKDQENLLLFKRLAHYCDAMQFSVRELQRLYGYLNKTSMVFENQISIVPPARKHEDRGEIVIGWGGSHGHLEDMADISEALIAWIMSTENVRLYLMCSEPIWALFDRLPSNRKRWFKPGSLNDYYAFLTRLDIGLAPLKDTAFNRSRSDVKFLEYAVHGVAAVVQAREPYLASVKHEETGFFFQDAAGLAGILGRLAGDVDRVCRVGKAARDYVMRERLQQNHGAERVEFYRSMLADVQPGPRTDNGVAMPAGRQEERFEALCCMEGAVCKGRYLGLRPTRFEQLLHDGLVLSQVDGKTEMARSLFAEAASLEPSNYLPRLYGFPCAEDAIDSLRQALKRNPYSLKSLILLGEEYAKKGAVVDAVKSLESAAEIFPEYEIPYVKTALLLKKIGRRQESISLAERAEMLISPLQGPGIDPDGRISSPSGKTHNNGAKKCRYA